MKLSLPWRKDGAAPAKPAPKPAEPATAAQKPEESAELLAQRDRLLEKFTVMQADLGGAFYEMAIRDHVRMDVLTRKAAELQRVDSELLAVERVLELQREDAAGLCPSCGAPFAPGVRFCAQCGNPLVPAEDLNATAAPRSPQAPPPTPPIPESSPLPQVGGDIPPATEPEQNPMRPPAVPAAAEAKPPEVPR
ncbi:MAG TPA: zinc ribbon domain-containing protein [Solirubrobacterales bacterium]